MPDKAGDRFTDKTGKTYELRPDPQGGHLRPYTVKNPNCGEHPLTPVITTVVMAGLRWIWNNIFKRKE